MNAVELSVVVPLYNEADNVAALVDALVEASAHWSRRWELVLVDDGSRDDTFARACACTAGDARLRVVRLRRNYGQTAAMAAGISAACGAVIVTMDGDLQNDPADIPRLLSHLDKGFDIVAGWRSRRQDDRARVVFSKAANRIISRVLGAPVRDTGCSLKAFRAGLLQGLPLYGDMHRFIPAISRLAGARLAEIEVNHRPRTAGTSKYGFSRVWKVALDIVSIRYLLWHARRPLRGSLVWAGLIAAAGVALTGGAALAEPPLPIVPGSLGIMLLSLATFVGAGGLLGTLYTWCDGEAACFALLSATVHAHHGIATDRASP